MLGAGQRVAGDEVHALGQLRPHRRDHRGLDRAHVADRGAGRKVRRDLGGDRAHGAHRHAEDDEIGALDRRGGAVGDLGEAEPRRLRPGLGGAGIAGDAHRRAGAADGVADRGGDQPEPDQRHVPVAHQARTRTKAPMAAATRAQPSASPTVIRSAAGSL